MTKSPDAASMSSDSISRIIHARQSVRAFLPAPVSDEELEQILDAARWAPSAGNAQPWVFFVIRSHEVKERLVSAALGQRFLAQAPVVIAVCADLARAQAAYGIRGRDLYCIQDTAAAVQNMLLTATSLGLGTCWVGAFDEDAVSQALELPEGIRPLALIPLGRPAEQPARRARRPLEELVRRID